VIISHRHRFIFFAVPRTATHSMRRALRPHLGEEDWEQQMLNGAQALPFPELAALGHGHIGYRRLRAHLTAEMLDGYFKFAFVRNPFDRFVSACSFLNRGNGDFPGRETACMKRLVRRAPFRRRVLIAPQSDLLTGEDDAISMDFVGRFETLQASFDQVCARIGIAPVELPAENASDNIDYARYYDGELRDWAAAFYRRDFELFEYDPHALTVATA
jgi:hypothetical protein